MSIVKLPCSAMLDQIIGTENITHITIRLEKSIIRLPVSDFTDLLNKNVTEFIMRCEKIDSVIIDPHMLSKYEYLESKYNALETQLKTYKCIINRLESDLKKDKFAQPRRYQAGSIYQNFNYISKTFDKAISLKNCNQTPELVILSDSKDGETSDKSNLQPVQTKTENIGLINLGNHPQNLNVKYKPSPKSKTNICVPGVNVSGNGKVLSINNTDTSKTLNNKKCLSTSIPKRKPGPKSRTRYVEHCVSSNTENKKTITNKICESVSSSVKTFKDAENANQNLFNDFSRKKYPPPYPITPSYQTQPSWKSLPPVPEMKIDTLGNNVTLTWNLKLSSKTAEIKMYELFVCKETDAPPDISMWKKKGSLNPDRLPMACELEMFDLGYIYHFALRAVDVHNRCAPFAVLSKKV